MIRTGTISQQGGLFQVKREQGPRLPDAVPRIRGKVTELSRWSRKRLMQLFATLDWRHYLELGTTIHFITITLPEHRWFENEKNYNALENFTRRLERKYTDFGCIIRKEMGKKSGAIHYHLVTFGLPGGGQECRNLIHQEWNAVLNEGGNIRTNVKEAQTVQTVCKYLCKYASKAASDTTFSRSENVCVGSTRFAESLFNVQSAALVSKKGNRWWYKRGNLVFSDLRDFDIDQNCLIKVAAKLRKAFKKIMMRKEMEYQYYKLLRDSGEKDWTLPRDNPRVCKYLTKKARDKLRWLEGTYGYCVIMDFPRAEELALLFEDNVSECVYTYGF